MPSPTTRLFAVGCRVDLAALFELLGEFMPEANLKSARDDLNRSVAVALGKEDFFKEVLPNIGPDFGFYMSAPPTGDKGWFPHTVLAVRVGDGGEKPPFRHAVLSALDVFARLAAVSYNQRHPKEKMSLKTLVQGNREVKYLVNENGFPSGFRPAMALHESYLLLASSPEVLGHFADTFKPGKLPPQVGRRSAVDARVAERVAPLVDRASRSADTDHGGAEQAYEGGSATTDDRAARRPGIRRPVGDQSACDTGSGRVHADVADGRGPLSANKLPAPLSRGSKSVSFEELAKRRLLTHFPSDR